MSAVEKTGLSEAAPNIVGFKDSDDLLKKTNTDELVIALCGPIGTPLHHVAKKVAEVLSAKFDYDAKILRLSDYIIRHDPLIDESTKFARIQSLIEGGNKLRTDYGLGILAELAIHDISISRQASGGGRVCHVVDSIKNDGELNILRTVYGDLLYVIGVYSPINYRVDTMSSGMGMDQIYNLIDRDSGEEKPSGQSVADTFPLCDYFLRVDEDSHALIEQKIERFISIILQGSIITPTSHERAMYEAAAASVNSACLSRQVGAAILNDDGTVISVGWNDVPKFRGNLYGEGAVGRADNRCAYWGIEKGCHNDLQKDLLSQEIVSRLVSEGLLTEGQSSVAAQVIRGSEKIKHLIEFSRAVHAEMHAILSAAALGISVGGCTLFCTTYPCHSCARHLIAAGITKVVFIEPYGKSLAIRLHNDSITEREKETEKVLLIPFDGVSPQRYKYLFEKKADRKLASKLVPFNQRTAKVKISTSMEAFPVRESIVVRELVSRKLIKSSPNEEPIRL